MPTHKPWRADYAHRQRAIQLRQEGTPAEKILWERLRDRRLGGLKFRRQHPMGRFILDFYCPERKAAIELDGSVHGQQADYDRERDADLQEDGVRLLRLANELIINQIDEALRMIEEFCKAAK